MTIIQKHHFRTYARIAQLLRPKSVKEYSKILLESSKEEKVNKVKGTLILLMYTVMKALRLHESPAFLAELKASCVTVDAYEFLQSNFREPTKEEHTKIMQKIIRIGECLHKKYENCSDKIEEYIGFHFPDVGYHLNNYFEPLQKILFLDLKNELPDWKKYGMLDLYDSILLNQFSNIDYEKQISDYDTLTSGEKSKLKAKCHREYKKAVLFMNAMDKFLTYPDIQAFRDLNVSFFSHLENAMINFKHYFNESVKKVFHIGDELAAPFFSFGERSSVLSAFCCMINANILVFYESCPEFFSEKNSNFFMNLKHAMETTNFFGAAYDCYVYYGVIRNFLQDLWKNEFTSIEVLRPRYEELIDNLKYMNDNTYLEALVMLHKDEKCDVIAQVTKQLMKLKK